MLFLLKTNVMENNSLAAQIARLRKESGFSQEKLADLASINLRTLQRIEKGETEPRGDTLRLIAAALEVPVENLFSSSDKKEAPEKEDKGFLHLMNLSALAYWIFPLGNIFVPLLLWHMKKDQVKGARILGKKIVNFQVTWCLLAYGGFFLAMLTKILHIPGVSPTVAFGLAAMMYLMNPILIMIAAGQLRGGAENVFSFGLKVIR